MRIVFSFLYELRLVVHVPCPRVAKRTHAGLLQGPNDAEKSGAALRSCAERWVEPWQAPTERGTGEPRSAV